MANASLDDLYEALQDILGVMEEIRDSGAGGGGGGAAGRGAAGRAQTDSKGLAAGAGGFSMRGTAIGGAFATGMAGARAFSGTLDSLGITAGLRASALGATNAQALQSGRRALLGTLANAPLGGFGLAQTSDELSAQGRAQSSVSGMVESVARAGGSFSEAGIKSALERQNELEGNVQKGKRLTEQLQTEVGASKLDEAGAADRQNNLGIKAVLGDLTAQFELFRDLLKEVNGNIGGAR